MSDINRTKHGRFPYSAIVDRPSLRWPNGARVAVWVIPNIEHFMFDRPATPITLATMSNVPDVLNYAWRDYGARVGVWRMIDVMEKHGIPGTAALNSEVCHEYPRLIEAGNALGWEWMGHGINNSTMINKQSEDVEREMIATVLHDIEVASGRKPRGWLGPALSESFRTLDILSENGVEYVGDWTNDEQPYAMRTDSGSIYSLPYSIEINDIPVFLDHHQSPEAFCKVICDQFDGLYEDGAKTGRVMAIALHPFLIGHPFRSKYLDKAFAHLRSRQEVWFAKGAEIIDWYKKEAQV